VAVRAHGSVRRSLLICAIAVLLLSGCSAAHHATGAANATVVAVTEADFKITAPTRLAAGDVVFRVHNRGPDQHEFILVKVKNPQLPFRTDGFTVNEESIQNAEPGSLVPGQPGATRDLAVHLTPGRYVMFCNMSGHFLGGMHQDLVVQ
jgi:uncharacterized cupredoxin-like copper-binding protein